MIMILNTFEVLLEGEGGDEAVYIFFRIDDFLSESDLRSESCNVFQATNVPKGVTSEMALKVMTAVRVRTVKLLAEHCKSLFLCLSHARSLPPPPPAGPPPTHPPALTLTYPGPTCGVGRTSRAALQPSTPSSPSTSATPPPGSRTTSRPR